MTEWRRGPIIGRGSSATVSLATSYPSGELFAVKSAELSKSDLLHNEQRILSSLNCLHIVSYLGFEATHLHYNLFLEYATGGSLSDHIKNHGGQLDEPAIRSHTRDILTGLSYLHSRDIVHCDIKPQNILIGSDGRPKIADLGCARWVNEDSCQVKGTPMYMAPEVARGEEQGPAADVWALGCTVFEMVSGSPPWPESNPITTLHRIAFSTAAPEVPTWVSGEGKDFLSKCLVRDPIQRWTAEQLLKHPFLELCSTKQILNQNWISPKTTLDQDMWEIFSDEEEEEYDDSNGGERIRELKGSDNSGPNWTWDNNWVTVRSDDEGCSMGVPEVSSRVSVKGKDFLTKCLVRDPIQRWTVEQLFRHPFLELCSTRQILNQNWISRKTTLDQDMWEIFSDEEEEEYEGSNSRERIRQLNGGCNSGPNWTWDDDWVTIRSDDEGCSITPNTDNDELAALVSSVLIGNMSSRIRQDFDSFASKFYDYSLDQDYNYVSSNCGDADVVMQSFSCKGNLFNFENKSYFSDNHYYQIMFHFGECCSNFLQLPCVYVSPLVKDSIKPMAHPRKLGLV